MLSPAGVFNLIIQFPNQNVKKFEFDFFPNFSGTLNPKNSKSKRYQFVFDVIYLIRGINNIIYYVKLLYYIIH